MLAGIGKYGCPDGRYTSEERLMVDYYGMRSYKFNNKTFYACMNPRITLDIIDFVGDHEKIKAIKLIFNSTNPSVGLRESKTYVEEIIGDGCDRQKLKATVQAFLEINPEYLV